LIIIIHLLIGILFLRVWMLPVLKIVALPLLDFVVIFFYSRMFGVGISFLICVCWSETEG
jgi:hypothetical protein